MSEEQVGRDKTPAVIAILVLAGFGVANWAIFTEPMPQGNETLIARVLGTLDMAVGLIIGYYFGSSRSSADKQDVLNKLVSK